MVTWIHDVPTAMAAALICAVCIGFTLLGVLVFRPIARTFVRKQAGLNTVVGNFLGVYGVIYGILLGLLAVAAYERNLSVKEAVLAEGTTLYALFRDVSAFPEPTRSKLQAELVDYNDHVIEKEWPQLRRGDFAAGALPFVGVFQATLTRFEPSRRGEEVLLAQTLATFDEFLECRATRLHRGLERIPPIMWWVVLLGAGINMLILWLLDMRILVQLVLGGIFSFYLGAVISLIVVMDRAFQGDYGLSPEVFERLASFMQKVMAGA